MKKLTSEIEIIAWMQRQGYDRKASQESAPIILNYVTYLQRDFYCKEGRIGSGRNCVNQCNACNDFELSEAFLPEHEKTI